MSKKKINPSAAQGAAIRETSDAGADLPAEPTVVAEWTWEQRFAEILRSDGFALFALAAATLLVYAQVVRFEFINIDDNLYVYDNRMVLQGLSRQGIVWAFTSFHAANWHPLTWISHMADIQLFGLNPGMIHAVNVLFHLINSTLVFGVLHKLTRSYWPSVLAAFVFALHPAHVESVAWVSERKDVLSTLFFLLTIWAYLQFVNERRDRAMRYAALIAVFALGLLAKSMLVTLPFVLLLIDYWPLDRLRAAGDLRKLIVEKLPLFVMSAIASVLTVMAQKAGGAISSLEYTPLATRFANTLMSYIKYIVMAFYPVGLGVMYPYPRTMSVWLIILAGVVLAAITAICLWQARTRKYLIVGWLWYLGTLVPVIGLVQVGAQSMADRYTYIPYIGLSIMIIWGLADLFRTFSVGKYLAPAAASLVVAVFGAMTFTQTSYWATSGKLYAHTIAVTENNIMINDNNCLNLIRQERLDEANVQCAILGTDHSFANAYNTWGVIQVKLANYDLAIKSFRRCVELNPQHALAFSNLALAESKLGLLDDAADHLKNADIVNNGDLGAAELGGNYALLAVALMRQRMTEKALPLFQRAVYLEPDQARIRTDYGSALSVAGRTDEAEKQLTEALRLDPQQAEAYNGLGLVYLDRGQKDKAIDAFLNALNYDPDLTSAAKNLARARGR